jgi:hypothetical protein
VNSVGRATLVDDLVTQFEDSALSLGADQHPVVPCQLQEPIGAPTVFIGKKACNL